ncbi:MAG: hypothetical protein IT457_14050 [Planctomycetes bacterium]|nr:hypothetical protein [Planctomycetota bacterium]
MKRVVLLTASAACFVGAAVLPAVFPAGEQGRAARARRDPGRFIREITRPFVLPQLWSKLADPVLRDDPAETVATLRLVAALVPEWLDGTIELAWRQAVELGREAGEPGLAAARLRSAERWLDEAAQARLREAGGAAAAAELWLTAACILTLRADRDPALAARYREQSGIDALERAGELSDRAAQMVEDQAIEARAAHAAVRVVASALRAGQLDRAQDLLDSATVRLAALRERETTARALAALRRLPPLRQLVGDPALARGFRDDPDLAEIVQAIEALATKRG